MTEEQKNLTEHTSTSRPLPVAAKLKPPESLPEKQRLSKRQIFNRILAVALAVGATGAVLYFAPYIQQFRQYGYPGIFLISLIANASIVVPIPALAITFTMGAVLWWPVVGVVAGIGEALGETTGYLAGYGGGVIIEKRGLYQRMHYWMEHHGMATIFVLSLIPNPVIDLAGIAAGAAKYPLYKFLLAAWMGKTIKTTLVAWAGAHSVTWLLQYISSAS